MSSLVDDFLVELVEYVLVFGITAGVAGAGVMLVGGAMPGLSQVAAASKSDQIAGAARISVLEERSITLVLPLKDSSVSCGAGSLMVSLDGNPRTYGLDYPCNFDFEGLSGSACSLTFSDPHGSLDLTVAC